MFTHENKIMHNGIFFTSNKKLKTFRYFKLRSKVIQTRSLIVYKSL